MNGGQNVYDLAGWGEVNCRDADRVRGAQQVSPGSTLTDIDGEFGRPVIYTEWWDDHERPLLRDYIWQPLTPDAWCTHFVPEAVSA